MLLITVSVPVLKMPAPSTRATFPETVLLVTVSVPELKMPPPPDGMIGTEFPETVLLVSVSVPRS